MAQMTTMFFLVYLSQFYESGNYTSLYYTYTRKTPDTAPKSYSNLFSANLPRGISANKKNNTLVVGTKLISYIQLTFLPMYSYPLSLRPSCQKARVNY